MRNNVPGISHPFVRFFLIYFVVVLFVMVTIHHLYMLKITMMIWFNTYLFFYMLRPEPHILLFRRPLGTDPQSGRVDPELAAAARDEYRNQFAIRR